MLLLLNLQLKIKKNIHNNNIAVYGHNIPLQWERMVNFVRENLLLNGGIWRKVISTILTFFKAKNNILKTLYVN